MLITSLQDTLQGIESKSYEDRSRERRRSYEGGQHMERSRHRSYSPRNRHYSYSPRKRDYRESFQDHQDSHYRLLFFEKRKSNLQILIIQFYYGIHVKVNILLRLNIVFFAQ